MNECEEGNAEKNVV